MPKNQEPSDSTVPSVPFIVSNKAASLSIVAAIIFVVSGVAWWKHVYNSPYRVFQGMLKTNLTTQSVTRTTITEDQGGPVEKAEQLSFVPQSASRTVVNIDQKGADGDTHVISETIGTPPRDYSRYVKIDTAQKNAQGKKLDYASVIGKWGETAAAQAYQQSILGLIPFANLKPADLPTIVRLFEQKKVYDIDYSKVQPKRLNGKSALVFTVKINTSAYVDVMKTLTKTTGLSDFKDLNPEDYKNNAPIEVKLTVDKLSRQLLAAEYSQSNQKETYSAYGLSAPIDLPNMTMPLESLQQRIQEVQ